MSTKIILALMAFAVAGCASYKQTLTNASGQTVTCEASGHSGIITGQYLKEGFDKCVANAEAQGYKPAVEATK